MTCGIFRLGQRMQGRFSLPKSPAGHDSLCRIPRSEHSATPFRIQVTKRLLVTLAEAPEASVRELLERDRK